MLITAALAQNDSPPKYNVRVDIVSIDVEVLDKDGNPVQDLTEDDFRIEENGKEVRIENFVRYYDNPVSLALLLDTSTIELKKTNIAKQFILNIIHLLDHSDDICLYSIDKEKVHLEADYTTERAPLVNAIENISVSSKRKFGFLAEFFSSDPPLGLGIDKAIYSHHNSAHSKKALLVISNRFRGLGPATVEHIQASRCTLYTLGFDNKSAVIATMGGDWINKKQLMQESGGRKFSAETVDIMGVSKAIVTSMKNYYSITYETEADPEGIKERRINVILPDKNYTIYARRTIKP
jgi:VWFA-related protein